MNAPSEAILVEQLRAGSDEAFESLVREHGGVMLATARRVLGQDADAQDAVQDAFVQAFRKIDTFHGESKLRTWLHRITVNASLMKLRSSRSRPAVSIDELLPQFLEDGHRTVGEKRWSDPGLVAAERSETRAIVREMIDCLPDDYREVVLLRDVEQLDTKETADFLGVGLAVVKTRLHRARQALRTLLARRFAGVTGC